MSTVLVFGTAISENQGRRCLPDAHAARAEVCNGGRWSSKDGRSDRPSPDLARSVLICIAAAACVAAMPTPTVAQAVYGSISGTVADTSGAVLPGVTVTLTSTERRTVDIVVTDEAGRFLKERLLPGIYEVKAELAGFRAAIVPRVSVSVDTQTPIRFTMEVGELAEELTVTGGAPLLKSDRADVATTFESRQITDLPVLDRNSTRFLLLTPGTQRLQWQHAATENPQGSIQIQVNGQHFGGTGYQLDGTENRDPLLGIIVINPTLESLAEIKVTSQNYEAEFGQATAGVVSMRTRSGANELHGSLFELNQDDATRARDPFTQSQPIAGTEDQFIPDTRRNQFGGSLGGPITRNRWFFFGDYQGTRNRQGGSQLLTVPTEAARRGDLSAYTNQIFDPATGSPGTSEGRAPFAGNRIPADRLSPQALALLEPVPLPNAPGTESGTRDNFIASGSEEFTENSYNVRIDGRLNDRVNTFGRYSLSDFRSDGPTAFGAAGGKELVSLGGTSDVRNQSIAWGLDHTISPTLLADLRFGWFRYDVNVLPFDYGTTPAADAGIPGLNLDTGFTSGMPAITVAGGPGFNLGSGLDVNRCNCPLDQDEQQWQIVGNMIKTWGNHTIKFGADVRRAYNLRVPSDGHRSGQLTFAGERTAGPGGVGGLGLATFLLGET
ncbi:MAG: carboxypeptidase regulatory-like domain-containing protein, partial [Vicinamibacteraceae bacterium]